MAKNGSFAVAEGLLVRWGQQQMCHLCGWLKLFLKKSGGKKNKKHRVGKRVGLLVVRLQYGLYVFGRLSKWFAFSCLSVNCLLCRVCLYACW
ncbi:MAG: hypothetical protein H0U27_07655 [Nitrosopumilus sp.]|nr:hypothetical protein [Nitrosopumilus sp.]